MIRSIRLVLGIALVASFAGCGGSVSSERPDEDEPHRPPVERSSPTSPATCYAQCEENEVLECEDFPLEDCRSLCDARALDTLAACTDAYDSFYTCMPDGGFECFHGGISPSSDTCMAKWDALRDCQFDFAGAACEGVGDDGKCPTVDCPCPDGSERMSGFQNEADGTCRCFDTMTCLTVCD
jgi:hypothetical protein